MSGIAAFAMFLASWLWPTTWLTDQGYVVEDPFIVASEHGGCPGGSACYDGAYWLDYGTHRLVFDEGANKKRHLVCSSLAAVVHELVHAWQAEDAFRNIDEYVPGGIFDEDEANTLHRKYYLDCFETSRQ